MKRPLSERIRDWWRGYSDDDLRSAYECIAWDGVELGHADGKYQVEVGLTESERRAVLSCPKIISAVRT